jgi:hypothetical protein
MWTFHYSYGSASANGVSCNEVIYKNESITINSHRYRKQGMIILKLILLIIMKIIHKDTNPTIKTHIPTPKGHMLISAYDLIGIIPIPPLVKISFSIRIPWFHKLNPSFSRYYHTNAIFSLHRHHPRAETYTKKGKCYLNLNKSLKKISSFSVFVKFTLFLLLLSIASTSILALSIHQPWRFLKILKRDELLLPKDPFSMPDLYIIEAANLDLDKYAQRWGIPIFLLSMSTYPNPCPKKFSTIWKKETATSEKCMI